MEKKRLDLYYVDGDYIKYLKSFDNNVQHNYDNNKNKKPYVGVVLDMNGKYYFAPLTSPKDKHLKLRDSDPTTFKIKHNSKFIGSVLLNNMIPVKKEFISRININLVQDKVYQTLLRKDYQVISNNRDKIENKAKVLYKNVIERNNPYFSKVSCDFKKLEIACDNYLRKNNNQMD
ncbi:type III toxin-antitoxin system ToxN/AbiQ family toxin [Avibacterium avium]|uniref:type III toxin-antitoxin system ToxN/AbiQ family toxin n=2 Tax=Avibacterium avium TaxID=751 RepID=UPI003BF7E557